MTKKEAIEAMKAGEKVTHRFFTRDEWITLEGNKILTKEGYRHDPCEFWTLRNHSNWETSWEIWKSEQ